MQIIKPILKISILWSMIYFGTIALIETTKKIFNFPGISILSKPEKICFGIPSIKVHFPKTIIKYDQIEVQALNGIVSINPFSILCRKPCGSLKIENLHLSTKLQAKQILQLPQNLNLLTPSGNMDFIENITIENILVGDSSEKYKLKYQRNKNYDWILSINEKNNPINAGIDFTAQKRSNILEFLLKKDSQTIGKAILAQSKKGNWILSPDLQSRFYNGIFIKGSEDKYVFYSKMDQKTLGWISKDLKTCSVSLNTHIGQPFFPSQGFQAQDLELQYCLNENNLIGLLTTIIDHKSSLLASLVESNNWETIKITSGAQILNHLSKFFINNAISFNGTGELELLIKNEENSYRIKSSGSNLLIENSYFKNPIKSVFVAASLSKDDVGKFQGSGSIDFQQGTLKIANCSFNLNKSIDDYLPENLCANGFLKDFKLDIPTTCYLTLDSEIAISKHSQKVFFQAKTNLKNGSITNNKLWTSEGNPEFQSTVKIPETELVMFLSNENPIALKNKDSCFNINFDLICPAKIQKLETGYYFNTYPLGKINITSGNFSILENQFSIKDGSILLSDKFNYKPIIDLHAKTHIKKNVVQLNLFGPLSQPFANFRSNTNLCHDKIAAMMFSGHGEEMIENQMMKIFPGFLVDILNKQMTTEKSSNKLIQKLGDALYMARNPTTNMKITPYLIESKLGKLGAALSFNPSPHFYAYLKKDVLNKDCLIVDAEYLLGESSSINVSRNKNKTLKGEFEFKFKF